jgi:predicted Zn-dependent protease
MANSKTKGYIVFFLVHFTLSSVHAQFFGFLTGGEKKEVPKELLMDREIQIGTTSAINNMYNYNFDLSEKEFKWLLVKYPDHPIGYFLIGMNYWWRIVPDTKVEKYDRSMEKYMDDAIDRADKLFDNDPNNKEAAFFLAAAYAFKGRLYAEREKWTKAAWVGKQSMKYLEKSRGDDNINPELLFGDGLYNFYSKWIHENYKSLRPLLTFFKKGTKAEGIKQLEEVANNAFYTRMEARYFLLQIYAMENQPTKGFQMAKTMHELYPQNSFFHRFAARYAFVLGRLSEAEVYAQELLNAIDSGKYGYGDNDGRYGAYILGYVNKNYKRNPFEAKKYYTRCIEFAQSNDSEESGYYLGSQLALGEMAEADGDYLTAAQKYKLVLENSKKKSSTYEEAKDKIMALKQKLKDLKKKRKSRNG